MTGESAVMLHHRIEPEDRARADFYAVLARLYAAAPDAGLLAGLGAAEPLPETAEAGALPAAWNRLVAASRIMDAEVAREEYTDLFIGVGRSAVDLHASHWLSETMSEQPLVEVRGDLARLGLTRIAGGVAYEDHLAALFEVMRVLITGHDARRPAPVAEQRAFFDKFLSPWLDRCCVAITQNSIANYYRPVAEFTQIFVAIERDAFAIE